MTAFLRTLPRRALTIVGVALLVISFPQFIWKSSEAEKHFRSARPLLDQLMSAQSGGEDAPAIPVVELEDRIRLTMAQNELEQGWSITTLRGLVMTGVWMTCLGMTLEKSWSGARCTTPGGRCRG